MRKKTLEFDRFDEELVVALDIETTGLRIPQNAGIDSLTASKIFGVENASDEILQLAIVDQNGKTLFYDGFLPVRKTSWPKAQAIHNIAPDDVVHNQTFFARLEEIQSIIDKATLLSAYNVVFDFGFLQGQGIRFSEKPYVDVMETFAEAFSKRKRPGYKPKWKSLAYCANFFGLTNEKEHNALADARLTMECLNAMRHDASFHVQTRKWITPNF